MKPGFFSAAEMQTAQPKMPHSNHCGACGKAQHCKHPRMPFRGKGRKKILVVGEAPGRNEDEQNEQFVGKAGQRLQWELHRLDLDLNRDCWKTNAVRCYPRDGKTPDSKTITYCRPALFQEIRRLKPEKILLFGNVPAESVLGHLWGAGKFALSTWTEWNIPHRDLNAWISVHYHPAYLERRSDPLLDLIAHRQLKVALAKSGRPWKTKPPKLEDEIEIIYQPHRVAPALRDFHTICAFDYETNCLKPEYPGAEIVSCAVSGQVQRGEKTVAFPWSEVALLAVDGLLCRDIKKIASNGKFEERWTRHFLGHQVRAWYWDTMLAAHVLNNAKGVSGLKFQSFVLLGLPPYDLHIQSFLRPTGGSHLNRIRELHWKDILLYNGMDGRCEYLVAQEQMRAMGTKLC